MAHESVRMAGKVVLEIHTRDGELVARAEGRNAVMDGGRQLLAKLLSGRAAEPQFFMVAGISDKETTTDLLQLIDPDGLEPQKLEQPKSDNGELRMSGSFPPADKERVISEAGLMLECKTDDDGGRTLYNRVLVAPAPRVRKEDVLTLTWTLSFARSAD